MLLLIQHCEGEPKKLIEFCLILDPQKDYLHAKSILKDNFGRKNQIARAFIDKLHSDTKIDTNNEIGLVNLACDLEECELTFRELKLHEVVLRKICCSKAKRLQEIYYSCHKLKLKDVICVSGITTYEIASNFVGNHSTRGLHSCDKINCVIFVLNRGILLGFAETMVRVRWKDVNQSINQSMFVYSL